MPSKVDLGVNVPLKPIDTNLAKTVLYLYETKIHGSDIFPYSYNQCEADQLRPTPSKFSASTWPIPAGKDSATAKNEIRQIGNVFILAPINDERERKDVKSIQNKAFADKIAIYKTKSNGIGTQQILSSKTEWTFDDIIKRSKSLAEAIDKVWPA